MGVLPVPGLPGLRVVEIHDLASLAYRRLAKALSCLTATCHASSSRAVCDRMRGVSTDASVRLTCVYQVKAVTRGVILVAPDRVEHWPREFIQDVVRCDVPPCRRPLH